MFVNSFYCRFSSILSSGARKSTLIFTHRLFHFQVINNFPVTKVTKSINRKSVICPQILNSRNMAGHSKWQNVKHVKAEKDRLKNLMCTRYVRLVSAAIRDKGPDPKANIKLANILEEAKKNNVPVSTLENAMKRGNNKKLKPGSVEILGPGGCFIIVHFETDNICDMRHSLKHICKKYSFNILSGEGRWRAVYEQKGIVKVTNQLNGEVCDGEKILDDAIEAGAEDVQKREDETDAIFYEFLSDPNDLHAVKKELEKNYAVEEAYIGYLPISTVSLSNQDMTLANNFLSELEDLPDIVRLFENVE